MEVKKRFVAIKFENIGIKYIKLNKHIKNKKFIFCCDLLLLQEYEEFEKKIKEDYWYMDNCLMIMEVIAKNNVEHFKYILRYIIITNLEQLLCYCCENGKFNIVEYLIVNNKNFNSYQQYCNFSANSGLYLIKKYYDVIKLNKDMFIRIAAGGTLEDVKWMRGYRKINKYNKQNIKVVQWKLDPTAQVCKWDSSTCMVAAISNNFDKVKWMKGYRKNNNGIWKLDRSVKKCPWNEITFLMAVATISIKNLEQLRKHNRSLSKLATTSSNTVIGFDLMRWMRGYRKINNSWVFCQNAPICPWDKKSLELTVSYGSLDPIKWLLGYRQNNKYIWKFDPSATICPYYYPTIIKIANDNNDPEIGEWLKKNLK